MKKYCVFITITLICILLLLSLAGCNGSIYYVASNQAYTPYSTQASYNYEYPANGQEEDATAEMANSIEDYPEYVLDEDFALDGIGGDESRRCLIHAPSFHAFDIFIYDVICAEDFAAWYVPLMRMRTSPYDECLANLYTFIAHFGLTREQFQQRIDETRADFGIEYDLDILFGGNRALIEAHYCITNEELHRHIAIERQIAYITEGIKAFQEIIDARTSSHFSRYFHDIWTFAQFYPEIARFSIYYWMRDLIEIGEYDKVNLSQFISDRNVGEEFFTSQIANYNMDIYTHYNIEILFSGNQRLIQSYYSATNEAIHTSHVQAAFEQHAAIHGAPDTSWMLER